ncbi:MAG TPA: beta-ketoacyl-ACP synthase III [Actinopolymorphaceae bacterium]
MTTKPWDGRAGQAARIVATGYYQPERILTNDDLARMVETDDTWIRTRVGIRERRIAADDEDVTDLATAAGDRALAASALSPADIDLVVVATTTAETRSPNTACSGFDHALATAEHAITAGMARNALVIGAEKLSAFTDWADRTTCVLVGDGAGAVVLSAVPESRRGVYRTLWGSVPTMSEAVVIDGDPAHFRQQGQAVFRWATTRLPELARETCTVAGLDPSELAGFVPHQANLRIIDALAEKLGLRPEAVVARDVIVSGNTSAASVPLAFAKLVEAGELPPDAPVLLFGFGGGLTYAGQVVRAPAG